METEKHCQKHQKPFESMCRTKDCSCSILLCQVCSEEHRRKFKNSQTMKIESYNYQISMESDIALKQYDSLVKMFESKSQNEYNDQMFKTSNDLKILESVMMMMTQDKKRYHQLLQEFDQNHAMVSKSLKELKDNSYVLYFKEMVNNDLTEILLYSQKNQGFTKFRKRLRQIYYSTNKFKEFLKATDKYGKTVEQFIEEMIIGQTLMKQEIKGLFGMKKISKNYPILSQKANIPTDDPKKDLQLVKQPSKNSNSQQNFLQTPKKRTPIFQKGN